MRVHKHFCTVNFACDFDELSTKKLLGQHFKSQFFDLWRKLALKLIIKNGKICFVILKLSFL